MFFSFLSFFFRNAGLNWLRCAIDQVLRLFKAKACQCANNLDDSDLICATVFQDDIKLGLLFDSLGSSRTGSGSNGYRQTFTGELQGAGYESQEFYPGQYETLTVEAELDRRAGSGRKLDRRGDMFRRSRFLSCCQCGGGSRRDRTR